MAKGAKKTLAPPTGMKPITDFFPRKAKLAVPAPPTSSPASAPPAASSSHTTLTSSLPPPDQPPPKTLRRSSRLFEEPSSVSSPSKRPAMRLHSPASALSPSRSRPKRKAKFDSDSDEEQPSMSAVVYVKSPRNNSARVSDNVHKKSRLSPIVTLENPSSQSFTAGELTSMESPSVRLSSLSYDEQQNVISEPPLAISDQVLACSPVTSDPHQSEVHTPSSTGNTVASFFDIPTPPLTDAASDDLVHPAPPSPVVLDSATKTAMLIASIKAEVYTKYNSSPEQAPLLNLSDCDDISDDDLPSLSLNDVKPVNDKDKSMAEEASPVPSSSTQMRYSLRNRIASSPIPIAGSSRATSTTPPRAVSQSKVKKGSSRPQARLNPVEELLKEKRMAEKRGEGEGALRVAEEAVSKLAEGTLLDEMDDEEDMANNDRLSIVPSFDANDDNISLAEDDRKRLFGEEGGKDIVNILQSDRERKAREKANQKIAGISLWRSIDSANEMSIDYVSRISIPTFHPVLQLLDAAVKTHDDATASIMLGSGVLLTIEAARHSDFINYLFDIAFSLDDNALPLSAFRALTHLWGQTPQAASVTFPMISCVLTRFGADNEVMKDMGWESGSSTRPVQVTHEQREELLYRFVRCLIISAPVMNQKDIPDIIATLLLIGMESTTSSALQQDISTAVNSICLSFCSDDDVLAELETAIVNKALTISKRYEPVNKAYLVSYLASGTGCTRRLAQWIAYCMIVGEVNVSPNEYSELPSLTKVIDELSDISSNSVFTLHEKTDYVDLGFQIYLLAVVLSNMKGYVEQEKALKTQITLPSPSKSQERFETDLQIIQEALERLHGRISDTRAAHLERSRTKAAVKVLSMRMYYQRETLLRNSHLGSGGKPRPSLRQYFTPKPTRQ